MTTMTTTNRIFNFSAGPAVLPLEVLEEAQRDLMALPGVGMSILEISHRSPVAGAKTDPGHDSPQPSIVVNGSRDASVVLVGLTCLVCSCCEWYAAAASALTGTSVCASIARSASRSLARNPVSKSPDKKRGC